jgi:hypothetical protein
MISFKTYYDVHSGKQARFSKRYSTRKAVQLSNSFDGKVKLFKDYYFGWFISPLRRNLREDSALITTSVLLSLCDVLEQFKQGRRSTPSTTKDYVKKVLRDIYASELNTMTPELATKFIDQHYELLRNGLHHDLTSRGIHIIISAPLSTMYQSNDDEDLEELTFSPKYFLNELSSKYSDYIRQLNGTDEQLKLNFSVMFDEFFELEDLN